MRTAEKILESKLQEKGIRKGWIPESKQAVLEAMEACALDFAEWIDIYGIRDGEHEWKYKGDNYKKKYSTQEMFDEYFRVEGLKKD